MAACRTALVYHEMYDGRGFSRLERSWGRYRTGVEKLAGLGLLAPDALSRLGQPAELARQRQAGFMPLYRPEPATEAQLATVHSLEHIRHVQAMDAKGEGMFDRNDTPAWPGVYRRAALAVGGTLLGADLVASGEEQHVFHVAGGLHHAQYDKVSGFCIFNDIVAAVRYWQTEYGYERIAVIDVDGHHGDGTQWLLYNEPLLTISLHQYDGRFFPRTGSLAERGEGAGLGYALNFPLPRYATDAEYFPVLEIALAELEAYRPQAIILQYGVDGHFSDRMVGLKLSTYVYERVVKEIHALAHRLCEGRLLAVGGGGYEQDAVARCWGILACQLSGCPLDSFPAYSSLHDPLASLPLPEPQAVKTANQLLQELQSML